MLTVAVPKRNKLPNIIVLTPKDGVTRSALQNATSVASTLLTTESVVANIKEETPAMPAGGAGMGMM
ncbi:MAG: hypothetical protein ACLUUG_10895 [Lachnospiraceae bacterium]